jgi:ubiquinone/menaquinone biosynthesis C-methylase UbiE
MAYQEFAIIYDEVMRGVDYFTWADYILNLANRFGFDHKRMLDLACGTGSLAMLLSARGVSVMGVDRSRIMLQQAEKKAREKGHKDLNWAQGDLRNFSVDETFPLITCLYDSVNYLLSEEDVASCLNRVFMHLQPGGGFIFDITTEYNIIVNFADYTFAENLDDFAYIWENRYNIRSKVIRSDVTIFHKDQDVFRRYREVHEQKIYPVDRMHALVKSAGFEILGTFDGFTLEEPGPKVERIHFVCRRPE